LNFPALDWWTDEIECAQALHASRVEALFRGEQPDTVVAIAGRLYGGSHGLYGTSYIDMLDAPGAWLADVLADLARDAHLFADPVTFYPPNIEIDPLGVHFIDALLGADTYIREGQYWSAPLDCDLEDLQMPDLDSSDLLQKALRLARLAVEASQGKLYVAGPVFSCPINIGINIFADRLLMGLAQRPDAAKRALRIITDTIIACVRAFQEVIPPEILRNSVVGNRYAPTGFGQIDGCATHLVSKAHYDEFFAPFDAEILATWPHMGMMHLCGAHAQHFETWSRMGAVRSIQTNDRAGEDLEPMAAALRDDQIMYVGPTETMTVDRIIRITGGRRLVLQCPLNEPIPLPSRQRRGGM